VQLIATFLLVWMWVTTLGTHSVLIHWILPSVLGAPIIAFLQMHEHADCALSSNGDSSVVNVASLARSTQTSALIQLVTWNMSHHAEHHLYTMIPFHALPRAHALLRPFLPNVGDGHLTVHRQVLSSWIPVQHNALLQAGRALAADASAGGGTISKLPEDAGTTHAGAESIESMQARWRPTSRAYVRSFS